MLVGLSIRNFKSIRKANIRFGAFTCLIGHNGVGKSNLFDAISFLAGLAGKEISEAAAGVRHTDDGVESPLDLVFGRDPNREIELSASMVVAQDVEDYFGQPAKPSTTLLKYTLRLKYSQETHQLRVKNENLVHSKLGDYKKFIGFATSTPFKSSVVAGRRSGAFISTLDGKTMLHGDGGSRGRPSPVGKSPLTVVGGTNTADYPTVLAAKREMSSWRVLHLEPSAMRTPDSRSGPTHISASGRHIPSTIFALQKRDVDRDVDTVKEIVNQLKDLNSGIDNLEVELDQVRNQLSLRAHAPGVDKWLYSRSLSDGTLRYIALAVMLADTYDRAVLCMEEPENGIHPSRIPSLVQILRDYAVDVNDAVGSDNPLRQVIVNSHSPEVVRQLHIDDLVVVQQTLTDKDGYISVFRPTWKSWRARMTDSQADGTQPIDVTAIAEYIGGSPISPNLQEELPFTRFGTVE